jgi:hypothetical protein
MPEKTQRLISEELVGPSYAPKILRRTIELVDAEVAADSVAVEHPEPTVTTRMLGPDYAPKMPVTFVDYPSRLEQ